MDYFGRLAKIWEEHDMYKPLPDCTCNAAADYEKEREEENVHQFIMGLDESRFGGVCQGIIATDSSIDLREAYEKVVREEQRLNYAKDREAQSNAVGFVAKKESSESANSRQNRRGVPQRADYGRRGHEKVNCWQMFGFPNWWEETPPTRNDNRGGRGSGSSTSSDRNINNGARANNAHAMSSNSSAIPAFIEEQLRAPTQIINEKTKSSDKLTGKKYGDLILDT